MARQVVVSRRPARRALVTSVPTAQCAVDAVPDTWASRLPPPLRDVRAGTTPLFEDQRMTWGFDSLGGIDGMSVLELGPLEAAHSYMAQQAGARRVMAVEANTTAFLKCLVVKELLGLDRCAFACGDVLEYLAASTETFDLCVACGILYHSTDPARMLDLISRRATRLLMWTHVYAPVAQERPHLARRLGPAVELEHDGYRYRAHRHTYGWDRKLAGYWGGTQPYSHWMPREELLRTLEHYGWRDVEIAFDEPRNPNGPAVALTAVRG
ncbi:MAG TPA: class I SAM-dependent methyltransferase [Solirubrobacteraceae bacterium]|nr:class I SAM-dependent methyltransferase [Solirubrobacteraceae bacterium]